MSEKRAVFALDTPPIRLLLIRHGETDYNKEGRFYGSIDTALNATGEAQALALRDRIADEEVDVIYSSPMLRAVGTATPFAELKDLPITKDPRLVELDHGSWEGVRFVDARDQDPELFERWRKGLEPRPHGGETLDEVAVRSAEWIEHIKTAHPSKTIAVFAHGGVLQVTLCNLLGTPHRSLWPYRFGNTTVATVLLFDRGGVLLSFC